jgi:hypothetical protein
MKKRRRLPPDRIAAMRTPYREPQIEEGLRNLVFQGRAGNRLTLLFHEERCDLELCYKPNAFRRRDFRARNFSNRDNWTSVFAACALPDLRAAEVQEWGYDPFVTRLGAVFPGGGRNTITVVNLADENAVAIAARQPLLLAIRPHRAFTVQDGLLLESFRDRGEDIASCVVFPGFERSRYRVLDDGTHIVQLMDDDVVLLGAEEGEAHARRLAVAYAGITLERLVARTEAAVRPLLAQGHAVVTRPDLQQVLDLNRREVLMGMDAGGACFGALNRIYHLIWVRDGSMTSCHMAQSGNPEFLRTWAPFLLGNPSWMRDGQGRERPEFLQLVGTRWTKGEDDGLFYAVWTAYEHLRATGDDRLLHGPELPLLIDVVERALEKTWDDARGLAGSDTLGEDPLASNPLYGYDAVNGTIERGRRHQGLHARPVQRIYSLYHQVNTANVLRMMQVLLAERPDLDGGRTARWATLGERLEAAVRRDFTRPDGVLRNHLVVFQDGAEAWSDFGEGDFWEPSWAVSQGPFLPLPAAQLATSRHIVATWPGLRGYGFCPWNTLARMLAEHGLDDAGWNRHLDDELAEARQLTAKYPKPGALTEYRGAPEGWRGLPFSAGSLMAATAARLLSALPQGLAVRAGGTVRRIGDYRWRLARLAAVVAGEGPAVAGWSIDGRPVRGSLQIPEGWLKAGANAIAVQAGADPGLCRLWRSDARLLDLREEDGRCRLEFASVLPMQLVFEHLEAARDLRLIGADGRELTARREDLPGTAQTVLTVAGHGGRVMATWG